MGIGFPGVALAFGLTVLVMVYAVGHISGGHFNPAVTLGAALAGRVEWKAVVPYMLVQVVAASVAGLAGIAIGLALTLIHLVSIPVSNTSVNPARSLGVAWFAGPSPCCRPGCSFWRRSSAQP